MEITIASFRDSFMFLIYKSSNISWASKTSDLHRKHLQAEWVFPICIIRTTSKTLFLKFSGKYANTEKDAIGIMEIILIAFRRSLPESGSDSRHPDLLKNLIILFIRWRTEKAENASCYYENFHFTWFWWGNLHRKFDFDIFLADAFQKWWILMSWRYSANAQKPWLT